MGPALMPAATARFGAWQLILLVTIPYWCYLTVWRVFNFQLMTSGNPGIIIAPPHLRFAQHLLLLPLLVVLYRVALQSLGMVAPGWRKWLLQGALALLFSLLARPILVGLVVLETGDFALWNELFDSQFGLRMSLDLWLSSASDFLLSYGAGLLLILGVRTHLDLKAETARSAYLLDRWTEGRLHALRVRVNPHFVVNTLKTTQSLVTQAPRRAEQILQHLAGLMQRTLLESGNELVPVHTEAECLRAYLEIQKLRFPELLNFRVDVAADAAQCMVPSMILQPVVEDAIVRNAGQRREPLHLAVQIARDQDAVELVLRGNCDARGADGTGTNNMIAGTLERLRALFGDRHEVTLSDSRDRTVLARLRMPAIQGAATAAA